MRRFHNYEELAGVADCKGPGCLLCRLAYPDLPPGFQMFIQDLPEALLLPQEPIWR